MPTIEELQADLAKAMSSIEKLESKNKELQAEKQKAKTEAEDAALAAETAAEEAARKAGDLSSLEKRLTDKFTKQLTETAAERDNLAAELKTIRVDNAITHAIQANNIKPEFSKAVAALLKAEVSYENGEASISGKSIEDYSKAFFTSKDGGHYVRPSDNSGGGSTGSDTTSSGHGFTKENIFGDKAHDLDVLARDNPTLHNSIVEKLGLAQLKV